MLAGLIENDSTVRKAVEVLVSRRKSIPMSGENAPDTQLKKELERLAASAPHMLADIGFERDPMACSSEKSVWRRGAQSVVIFNSSHAEAFV